jgi:hypothetical protein
MTLLPLNKKLRFDSLQAQVKEKKDKEIALASAKTQAISNALGQGAPASIINAIKSATDEAGVVTALGKYNADLLAQEAQRANIAQSWASVSTLSLAEKGDINAIEKLGFDPRQTTGNFEAESNLRKEFNTLPTVKEAVSVQQSYAQIKAANEEAIRTAQTGGSPSAADQALIISFNKMLDPTSVVREGEFARSTQGQSYLQQLQAKVDQAMRGGAGTISRNKTSFSRYYSSPLW